MTHPLSPDLVAALTALRDACLGSDDGADAAIAAAMAAEQRLEHAAVTDQEAAFGVGIMAWAWHSAENCWGVTKPHVGKADKPAKHAA